MEQAAPESVQPSDTAPMDDAEAQMRRALGLNGTLRPRADSERIDQAPPMRSSDRFTPAHRRRFVQDGDVPVAYVRREQQVEATIRQPAPANALSSRLERAEAAVAVETAARQLAERSLQDAQGTIRDLRTKLGHADLARNEAVEALRRDRETHQTLRADAQDRANRLQESEERIKSLQRELTALQGQLAEERSERRSLEKALRSAQDARESAERLVQVLAEPDDVPAPAARRPAAATKSAPKTARKNARVVQVSEPEPVKWWLSTPAAKRK